MLKNLILASITLITMTSATVARADQAGDRITTEHEIARIDPHRVSDFIVSPDGRHVAYVVGAGRYGIEFGGEGPDWEKHAVSVDGKVGRPHTTDIQPLLSPDGKHVGFSTGYSVVIDDVEGEHYGERGAPGNEEIRSVGELRFSPDGNSAAYVASNYKAEGPSYVVLNGKKQTAYWDVLAPQFSPDGKQFAYMARADNPRGECVVVNGKESERYQSVLLDGNLLFSPDSKHLTYTANEGDAKRREYFVVMDGSKGKHYAEINNGDRMFSSDSQHFIYFARNADRHWAVVLDGKEGKSYAGWNLSNPVFSPDGKRLAFVVITELQVKGGSYIVLDGQESPRYMNAWLGPVRFSADSRHTAYNATRDNKKWFIVADGVEGMSYDFVGQLSYNPTSMQLAYVANTGKKSFLIYDGKIGKQYDQIVDLKFSEDGKTIVFAAYLAKNKKWYVVTNGQESRPYDYVLVKDAPLEMAGTSAQTGSLRFDAANDLHYIAIDKKRMLLVESKQQQQN